MALQQEATIDEATEIDPLERDSTAKVTERIKDIYKDLNEFKFEARFDGLGRMTQHYLSQPKYRPIYEATDAKFKQLLQKVCEEIKSLENEFSLKEIWKGITTRNGVKLWATEDSVSHQESFYKVDSTEGLTATRAACMWPWFLVYCGIQFNILVLLYLHTSIT